MRLNGFEVKQQKLALADCKSDRFIELEDDKINLDTSCERSTVFVILIFKLGTITLSNEY